MIESRPTSSVSSLTRSQSRTRRRRVSGFRACTASMMFFRSSAGLALQVIESGRSIACDWQYDLRRWGDVRLTNPATENVPVAVTRLQFRFLVSCMMARSESPRNGASDAHQGCDHAPPPRAARVFARLYDLCATWGGGGTFCGYANPLMLLVAGGGFEPPTFRL